MKKDVTIRLGKRIRDLRRAKGLSQEEFADRIDLDRTYVSGVERGMRNPTLKTLQAFAEGLSVTLSHLLEGI
jgi:transcriptional regulator with XRE-family HTH domain